MLFLLDACICLVFKNSFAELLRRSHLPSNPNRVKSSWVKPYWRMEMPHVRLSVPPRCTSSFSSKTNFTGRSSLWFLKNYTKKWQLSFEIFSWSCSFIEKRSRNHRNMRHVFCRKAAMKWSILGHNNPKKVHEVLVLEGLNCTLVTLYLP